MSLLGNFLGLSKVTKSVTSTVNYGIAPATQLFDETYNTISSTFSTNPFNRISQAAPSFSTLGISTLTGAPLSPDFTNIETAIGASARTVLSTSTVGAGEVRATLGDSQRPDNEEHKVRLRDMAGTGAVLFEIMPEVTEVHAVEYEPLSPPQLPGEFQKYRGTKSVQWTIIGTFTARTQQEAQQNYEYVQLLRTWTKSFFGENQRGNNLGAPPPVIEFSGWRGLVGKVPVVITSLNWNWPKDVDWLPTMKVLGDTGQYVPFPAVMNVNINVVETFSAAQFNGFNLQQFRSGDMVGAYTPLNRPPQRQTVAEPVGGAQVTLGGTPVPVPAAVTTQRVTNTPNLGTSSLDITLLNSQRESLGMISDIIAP